MILLRQNHIVKEIQCVDVLFPDFDVVFHFIENTSFLIQTIAIKSLIIQDTVFVNVLDAFVTKPDGPTVVTSAAEKSVHFLIYFENTVEIVSVVYVSKVVNIIDAGAEIE